MEIIYEDEAVIVCYKPAGIATQTKRLGQQDMESLLKNYRVAKQEVPYIGVVHRLDQPVEGIMVFAKTKKAAAELSAQVQSRSIGKYYYAVAPMLPDGSREGILTDYLLADRKNNCTRVVTAKTPQAQKAKLAYRIAEKNEDEPAAPDGYVRYDIRLHTGRHHQIRVQLASRGCPLYGDQRYGSAAGGRQLALCSYRICFAHPDTGEELDFSIQPKNPVFAGKTENEKAHNEQK